MKLGTRPSVTELRQAFAEAMRLFHAGRLGPSARLLEEIVRHLPNEFDAVHLLGAVLVRAGKYDKGIERLTQASKLKPNAAAVWVNLASAQQLAKKAEAAVASFESAAKLEPAHPEINNRLCVALVEVARHATALSRAKAFTASYPNVAAGWVTLGVANNAAGLPLEAERAFAKAVECDPGNMLARFNLGISLGVLRRYREALPHLAAVLERHPDDRIALQKLWIAKRYECDWEGLGGIETQLLELARKGEINDPFVLVALTDDSALLCETAAQFARAAGKGFDPSWRRPVYRHDRLRLAYVSGDFLDHPVAHAIRDLIAAHDRERFEVFCVSTRPSDGSDVRRALENSAEHFIDAADLAPAAIAAHLRGLEIDVALDLSGPTVSGLPLLFAERLAPTQAAFLGFPGTTGAAWFDYMIADSIVVPPGQDHNFTELVIRLPNCFFPASRRDISPVRPTRESAGLPDDAIVLVCTTSPHKISPAVLDTWLGLLAEIEGSVLWLPGQSEAVLDRLRAVATARGIVGGRIVGAKRIDTPEAYLARLGLADISLDTTPYGAHSTALDALWAGVPLVTFPGGSFASRVGASMLTSLGLAELVAASEADYCRIVRELAGNKARLASIRHKLNAARTSAPLFDVTRYARDFERALLAMHAEAGGKRTAISIPPD